ncbi:AraC family transcriptional regulator [Mucilaginibacter pallidiroseus]|uniref:AraC family transcriptional regulator n=1 Tax=Mucilaginibacter pallidiroseus TaxID=2599295 RepID=A0A563U310_9SPHI|nr:helix-turn-helix transcriptional regulator [Mucilaginibacter pallidiroseus]TWR25713.1 AraC family transcriptional regulator [Mucilaginibacter pallidiroseus]
MKNIPIHQLKDRTDMGMELWRYNLGDMPADDEVMGIHRDDHYIFFVVDGGDASLLIDFEKVTFTRNTLYYILPGQVHQAIDNERAAGWFLAVDASLIPADYREVFEGMLQIQQPCQLDGALMQQSTTLLNLLGQRYNASKTGAFNTPVLLSLLQSFLGIAASCYADACQTAIKVSRPVLLSQQFKRLLVQYMVTVKSPSAYADMLNVSESYLNESLKKTTGLPVSYWILNEVVLEAKRLLYYSSENVKEIAHKLGYEGHTYFSRLFKKSVGLTPLAFRAQYRK